MMKIEEYELKFTLDKSYFYEMKQIIKSNLSSRIEEAINEFLEKKDKKRVKLSFEELKEEYSDLDKFQEEFIERIYENQLADYDYVLSTSDKIKVCQYIDDIGISFLSTTKEIGYNDIESIISRDCSLVLNSLINQEITDFISHLKKAMEEMGLHLWEMVQENNLGWMRHKREKEPNNYTQVYCYRCIEGEKDLNIDVYELRFEDLKITFEKSVTISQKEQMINYKNYLEYGS